MDPYDGKGSFNSHNKELKLQSLQQLKNLKNELNSIAVTWDLRDYEKRLQVVFVMTVKQELTLKFIGFHHWNPKMCKFLEEVGDNIQKVQSEGGNQAVLSLFPINNLCRKCLFLLADCTNYHPTI